MDNRYGTEPTQEPTPASPPKTTPNKDDTFLSPVSKLELAKQYAAKEQQKRVDAVCARMADAKKEENLNRLRIQAQLEIELEQRGVSDGNTNVQGAFSIIASKVVDTFKSALVSNSTTTDSVSTQELSSTSSTEVLHGCPATTTFHLKQLGLVHEKVNIYAPLHDQSQGLRQRPVRKSALRCQESFSELKDEEEEEEEDSDYDPEMDGQEGNSESESEWDSEELKVEKDEMQSLVRDQMTGIEQYLAALRKHSKHKTSLSSSLLIIFVFILLALLAVVLSEEYSGFCQRMVKNSSSDIEGTRRSMCNVVLQLHRVLRMLNFR